MTQSLQSIHVRIEFAKHLNKQLNNANELITIAVVIIIAILLLASPLICQHHQLASAVIDEYCCACSDVMMHM